MGLLLPTVSVLLLAKNGRLLLNRRAGVLGKNRRGRLRGRRFSVPSAYELCLLEIIPPPGLPPRIFADSIELPGAKGNAASVLTAQRAQATAWCLCPVRQRRR